MEKIIKSIIFILIFNVILLTVSYTLLPKINGYNSIDYFKNNNQLDIIWLGPSTTFYSISPMYIWNKYKVTSYNNTHNGQRLTSFFALNDMRKYNPKIIFFDIRALLNDSGDFVNNISFDYVYKWHLSFLSRIEYLKFINKSYHESFYLFLLDMFHTRWKSIDEKDFINNNLTYYFLGSSPQFLSISQKQPIQITGQYKINDDIIKMISIIAQYIKDNNLKVVFWLGPTAIQNVYERSFLFEEIIKEYNIPYINFNKLYSEININYKRDFMDISHINMYGGQKVSDYLIEYAIKNYNIKPHTNDPAYASWNEDYSKYGRAVNREEIRFKRSFQEWQNLAYYDNYTMLISTNGDNVLNRLPQSMKDKFKTLGLNKFETDKKNQKYAAIIDNNQVFFEEISDKKVEYKGRMKNIVNLLVSSEFNKATINVSGKPRAKNRYGINFVIYDKVNREIVDSIWVDPAKPDEIRR